MRHLISPEIRSTKHTINLEHKPASRTVSNSSQLMEESTPLCLSSSTCCSRSSISTLQQSNPHISSITSPLLTTSRGRDRLKWWRASRKLRVPLTLTRTTLLVSNRCQGIRTQPSFNSLALPMMRQRLLFTSKLSMPR